MSRSTAPIPYYPDGERESPRWTPATRELVCAAIDAASSCSHPGAESCQPWWHADAALRALADAGLLLPAGGESREVFDVETRGCHWPGFENEAAAWRQFAAVKAWPDKPKVWIVCRTVTVWPDGRRHVSPGERLGGDALEDGAS